MNMYIKINPDKTPVEGYKAFYNSYEHLDGAGLVLDEDVVVVDFDNDVKLAEKIIETTKTKAVKTSKGYHLYFTVPPKLNIKNYIKKTTVCGAKVDYKTGNGGKKQYAIVKLNGVEREIINKDCEKYPVLPLYLYPIKTTEDVLHLSEGNRNATIFKHFSNIRDLNLTNDIDGLLSSCIDFLIDYMDEPLPYEEFESIKNSVTKNESTFTVDEFYKMNSRGVKSLDIDKVVDVVSSKLDCTIYRNILYFRTKDNYYSSNKSLLFNHIKNTTNLKLRSKDDDEIYKTLYKIDKRIDLEIFNMPINLRNKVSISKGEVVRTTNEFTLYFLDVEYKPDCYDEHVDKFIKWFCNYDTELEKLLEEILGHMILTGNKPQYAFFFVANEGKNGKSTFLKMIHNFMGLMASGVSLEQLNTSVDVALLDGVLVNCGDDINNGVIKNSRNFKNLASGDIVVGKKLYRDIYTFKSTATLIFTANEIPKFLDTSGGFERRLVIIPCENTVSEADFDPELEAKLSTERAKSYILNLALIGAQRILQNKKMTIPAKALEMTQEYKIDNNTVVAFMQDQEFMEMNTNSLYMNYKLYCNEENRYPVSKTKFSRELKKLGYEVVVKFVNGKAVRYYAKH